VCWHAAVDYYLCGGIDQRKKNPGAKRAIFVVVGGANELCGVKGAGSRSSALQRVRAEVERSYPYFSCSVCRPSAGSWERSRDTADIPLVRRFCPGTIISGLF
jgi:hypothetical protein